MLRHLRNNILPVFSLCVALIVACGGVSLTEGDAVFLCDESVLPAVQRLNAEFTESYPNARVEIQYGNSSSVIRRWLDKESSVLVVTRKLDSLEMLKAEESSWSVKKIALDGLAIIVNRNSPLTIISPEQFSDIYARRLRLWSDLNKSVSSDSILLICDETESGNRYYFSQLGFQMNDTICRRMVISDAHQPASAKILEGVAANRHAIGVVSSAWLTENPDYLSYATLIRILEIIPDDGSMPVEPHPAYLYRGDYPFRRIVYLYSWNDHYDPAAGLAAFICGNEGQKLLPELNMAPLVNPVRLVME